AFRIDHITATNPQTSLIIANGYLWGVIDHITMTTGTVSSAHLVDVHHDAWAGSGFGDGSWAEPLSLGTEQAIYVEDCTLTGTNDPYAQNFTDGLDGGRIVVRHNTFTMGNTGSHGTDSGQRHRGIRSQEIYDNTFVFHADAIDFTAWFRGGT